MAHNTKIKIGTEYLEFALDGTNRVIIYKEKPYKFLMNLVRACPRLTKDKENLAPLANSLNYLLFGDQFDLIEKPIEYVEKYWARKKKEQINPSKDPEIALIWRGMYDVYILIPPHIEEEVFYCCLENRKNGLAYILAIPYPIDTLQFEFDLQPIPFAKA